MKDDRLDDLDPAQRDLALRLRGVLRETEKLDVATSSRLARARAQAAAVAQESARVAPWMWTSGGLTAAAIIAVVMMQFASLPRLAKEPTETAAADAIDVLTDDVDPDLYEDLDLYRWLAEDNGRA